mgnify:CR=1 FL=1
MPMQSPLSHKSPSVPLTRVEGGGSHVVADGGGEPGGHGAVIVQNLVVVVAGGQCQCQRCESKKSGFHCKSIFYYLLHSFCYIFRIYVAAFHRFPSGDFGIASLHADGVWSVPVTR